MERLTIRVPDEPAYAYDEDAWTVNDEFGVCCLVGPVVDRLAAYEDTGLEPSEVAALVARCEAAERDIRELLAQLDYVGVCWACAKVSTPHSECDPQWRGPQEGATAHERV